VLGWRLDEVRTPKRHAGDQETRWDMSPEEITDTQPVLRISDAARAMVLGAQAEEEGGEPLALWLEVSGTAGPNYTYDMYFEAMADAGADDVVQQDDDGLAVVIPAASADKLRGATLDVSSQGDEAGMVIVNPNSPTTAPAHPPADLSGEVAQRVIAALNRDVNPGIAAHGGRADLVAVEEGTAYLRLSGGCQGCGMATVTLSQGIEGAIRGAVPEITAVVDVTDHASGSNPYFESAKK